MTATDLENADTIVRKSLAEGKPVKVKGLLYQFQIGYESFIIDTIEWAEDVQKSQVNEKVVDAFVKECAKHQIDDVKDDGTPFKRPLTPLDVMMDDTMALWAEIYADNDLKTSHPCSIVFPL